MNSPARKKLWFPSALGVTISLVLLGTSFVFKIKADDIWWHLKTGQVILELWHLPQQNLFSFTAPEHPWLPHEWLAEVLFYVVYHLLGWRGLLALGIALNGLACTLLYRITARYSRSPFLSTIITLLAALMLLGNFSLRPYLFGNLFFICTLHAMEEPTAGGRLRPALLFGLFATWANFHGSFLIGLALIFLHGAAAVTDSWFAHQRRPAPGSDAGASLAGRTWRAARPYARDLLVATLACIVTPNHVFGLVFPLTYLRKAFGNELSFLTNISEWQPAGFGSPLGRMITFYLLFCGFAVIGSGKAPRSVHVGMLAAFAIFAYSSIRNIPLLGIAATPVLARHFPATLGRTWKTMVRGQTLRTFFDRLHQVSVAVDRRSRALLLPAVTSVFLLATLLLPADWPVSYTRLAGIASLADLSPSFYPRSLLENIDSLGRQYRIFNYFNWGGAFIWHSYPRQRVFIDQRNDCYPLGVFRDYFAVHRLEPDWRAVLERWDIELVAYPAGSRLARALATEPGWTLLYQDSQAVLFARDAVARQMRLTGRVPAQPPR